MVTQIWVNIGSDNGLLPDGTKPLPEPMLIYHHHHFIFSRLLWLLIVVTAITVFTALVLLQVIEYFQYRNTVNVEIKAVDNVVFPAVTICNHNRYR